MLIVNVLTKRGNNHVVEIHDMGVRHTHDDNGDEYRAYTTDVVLGSRYARNYVDCDLVDMTTDPAKFRLTEDQAFIECLVSEIDPSGIEVIYWPKV